MLPRSQRFSLREDPEFFHTAHRIRGSFFAIMYRPAETADAQAVFVAAKKNFPTAVARNKVKRQLRELVSPLLAAATHQQIVIMIYKPLEARGQQDEIQKALQTILF